MSRPLRLVVLIGAYAPVVGGGERHAQSLSEALVRQGHQVTVVTRRTRAELAPREEINGVRVIRVGPAGFPRWGKYLMMPAAAWTLFRLRKETDVLQVCAFRVLGWVGVWHRGVTGVPVVLRAEACGEWSGAFTGKPVRGVLRFFLRLRNRCFLRCDRFLSISRVIRAEYVEGGIPESKILDITNGIELTPFRPADNAVERTALRRDLGLPDSGRLWCYAGKLIRGKGLSRLVDVFAEIAPRHPDLKLVLIGSGAGQFLDCEAEIREKVRQKELEFRVVFTGYTDRIPEMLRACEGMVFPSEAESLGLAPVEAMASGLPVIVSDVGGLKDVVEDGKSGLRVSPRDNAAWVAAWESLLDDPTRAAKLARAGRERAARLFDIERVAAETAEQFAELLTER